MKKIKINTIKTAVLSFILTLLFASVLTVSAKPKEVARYLEVFGKVQYGNKDLCDANVTVFFNDASIGEYKTSSNGKFDVKLDMNGTYYLHFSKQGMMTKIVKVQTIVPESLFLAYQYEYKFNVELEQGTGNEVLNTFKKPSAEIFYNVKYDGFDCNHDNERELRVERRSNKPAINASTRNIYNDAPAARHGSF